jgi:hypothetical protein
VNKLGFGSRWRGRAYRAIAARSSRSPLIGRLAPRKFSPTGSTSITSPPAAPENKSKYPPKVSFYQDPADTARVRGAILHTQVAEGTRSLSDFINTAVMAEVHRLEAKCNDSQPFPAVGARGLPQGRPLGR